MIALKDMLEAIYQSPYVRLRVRDWDGGRDDEVWIGSSLDLAECPSEGYVVYCVSPWADRGCSSDIELTIWVRKEEAKND